MHMITSDYKIFSNFAENVKRAFPADSPTFVSQTHLCLRRCPAPRIQLDPLSLIKELNTDLCLVHSYVPLSLLHLRVLVVQSSGEISGEIRKYHHYQRVWKIRVYVEFFATDPTLNITCQTRGTGASQLPSSRARHNFSRILCSARFIRGISICCPFCPSLIIRATSRQLGLFVKQEKILTS